MARRSGWPTDPEQPTGHRALGAAGAARVVVLGSDAAPAVTVAGPLAAAVREIAPQVVLAPATPNGRDLAAVLVGSLGATRLRPHPRSTNGGWSGAV